MLPRQAMPAIAETKMSRESRGKVVRGLAEALFMKKKGCERVSELSSKQEKAGFGALHESGDVGRVL